VRSSLVVVLEPFVDDLASVFEAIEPVRVQTLIAEPTVEAFDEGVVDGLSRTAEMKIDSVGVRPTGRERSK